MNKELSNLIKKYSGNLDFRYEDDLEWDLGITGDDAFDFMVQYGNTFKVDISNFKFEEYFHDEGNNILLLFKRIIRKNNKKRLTPNDLLIGIKEGVI